MSSQAGPESRVKKTLINARVNLVFYFLTLVLSFFSRKIFLDTLGADFVGLTGTLQNLLGFLNLAELGIGTAIGYVLYKPLYEHNQDKINEIISVMGYLYRNIGFVILGAGCVLACFLPMIFPSTGFELSLIYFAYFSFLASSLIGYFVNYRQNLLGADQRNYVVTAYFQTANIVKTIIQMAFAYYTHSFYLWVLIELLFGIIYSFILNWKINQTYPWLRAEIRSGRLLFKKYPEVMRYTKQLFVHQISSFVQFQTTPFLIYTFVSLQIVAFYGNYTIILDKLTILMNTVLGSVAAGVGNLIAEGNKEKIKDVFWELTTIRFFVAGFIFFSLFLLLEPFIGLWIGKSYILDRSILILALTIVYVQVIHGCLGQFLYGYGLFSDVWAPVVQSTFFLIGAIGGGFLWGLPGILFASIISIFLVMGVWKPYFLYKRGFNESVGKYWAKWVMLMCINIASFACSLFFVRKINIIITSFFDWIIYACVIVSIYFIINVSLMFMFNKYARRVLIRFNIKINIGEICYFVFNRIPKKLIGKYIKKNLVYVHWGRYLNNFGDCLSPDILKYYGLTPVYVPNTKRANIVLAGSILQWIPSDYSGIIVGTGGDKQDYSFPNAEILAVRGKLTLQNIQSLNKNIKIGDPGLLMPYVYPEIVQKKYKLGIVPHFVDKNEAFLKRWKEVFGSQVLFIDVLRSPKEVIEEIKQCEYIISSSLHGLIIADAFHIPNARIVCRNTMPTSFYDYKFDDYFSSINCESTYIEVTGKETIEELIEYTTLKPVDAIESIKSDLNDIMIQVCKRFNKR